MSANKVKRPRIGPQLADALLQVREDVGSSAALADLLMVTVRQLRNLLSGRYGLSKEVEATAWALVDDLQLSERTRHDLREGLQAHAEEQQRAVEERWAKVRAKAANAPSTSPSSTTSSHRSPPLALGPDEVAEMRQRYEEAMKLPPEVRGLSFGGQENHGPGARLWPDEIEDVREWHRPRPQPAGSFFRDWQARNRG